MNPKDDPLADFLHPLLSEGRVVITLRPLPARGSSTGSSSLLNEAFETYRLGIGGPPLPFDPAMALAAAEVVYAACSALLDRSERPEALAARLAMPRPSQSPSHHLSADLTLRFLPQVHRRARGLDSADPLVTILCETLRAWPLSGVLAELDEPPTAPLDFGGHSGLMMLYAERLLPRLRESWYPQGVAGEYVELVRNKAARAR